MPDPLPAHWWRRPVAGIQLDAQATRRESAQPEIAGDPVVMLATFIDGFCVHAL